ncbi:gliding motility-associated C-terminal domain-containing protein [Mucilaginibacter mallensis]|uniref:Gliding motility-associated C-terminal domain-containing protein n=1 Tax=Mucilaginibacter mallensis TaxID=652787 RepID=A0A1H2A199_MUCMA|nr:gliding motility-associated C-terminal domain-containing protein [Mucilaginibacter mallensis]
MYSTAIAVIFIFCCLQGYSQGSTNKGTEFWTAYMANSNPPGTTMGSQMDLYITSDVNTSGTVEFEGGSPSMPFNVTANQVTVLNMPAAAYIGVQGQSHNTIHITSLKPVAIYAHIFAENSSGATLLLPVNTLGKDYTSINYTQKANQTAYSTFMVIGTEDNTTVEITPSVGLLDGTPANKAFSVVLNKGDVYQGLAGNDLTGTHIQSVSSGTEACKKIAVFSGSTRIQIGCNPKDNSSDNLFQQVYPTASWGKNYITVPLKNRDFDIIRVILSNPATNVTINGQLMAPGSFINGLYYEFNSSQPNIITADEPIQVAQYAVSQGNTNTTTCDNDPADIGDPEMIYLTPLEQTLDHVTLFSTSNYLILASYINVLIKTDAASSFKLDGQPYNQFSVVPNNNLYSYAQISVSNGTHNISASDGFNAIAYGFGEHESYGYAAGANLQDLDEYIALQNPQTKATQSNGCTGVNYNLQLTLPYKTTSIQWDFQNGTTPYTDTKPVAVDSITKGTQTLYIYSYPKNPVIYSSGSYSVIVTVFNPTADVCGSTETIELDYTISNPPVAKFSVDKPCFGDSTQFTDQTVASNTIKSWLWNFGDNQQSTLQNPAHKYLKPGNYNVSLTVTDIDSCTSVFSVPNLTIDARPVALFAASTPDCETQNITFTDQSTTATGNLVKWIWDFGDGTTDTVTSKTALVNHTYAKAGIDTVKLIVINDSGCSSLAYAQPETINPMPVVDFTLPDVCLAAANAQFTDASTITDNTQDDFTYLWNFGDANANDANANTSNLKNPQHKYSQAANYNVTLTVTSKYGCSVSKTQLFTVNGSNPAAHFFVENSNDLCSSDNIVFEDRSSVDFGNITSIVWYFDYNNNPANSVVYTRSNMPADKKYYHQYPLTNSDKPQYYDVRMVVYSGASQSCASELDSTITVNGNPTVTLTQLGTVCSGSAPVQIIANTGEYTGTSVFSGTGISPAGLFSPGVAGLGTFTINYLFTATNGCTYTASQQVNVVPTPQITVDSSITMLEGSEVRLNATATGDNLTYKWTPATGLNRDDIPNPVVSLNNDVQYTLTITSGNNCTATATVLVNVLKNLVIPNTFTPNGDGINDTWNIKYLDNYPNCTVDIFNRYGEKLFTSVGYPIPWDGKYKGSNLPVGTYYYIINPKNGRKQVSGYVTIIR